MEGTKQNIVILGSGMVGRAIAADLSYDFNVTAVDIDKNNLAELEKTHSVKTVCANLGDVEQLNACIKDQDLVIGAVPGFMGYETLKNVILIKKNIVDISFFPEDPFDLCDLAKDNNVTAIIDCGVAPGMSNLILGYHNARMDVKRFECYVGGLPFTRTWPFNYKAPFSPIDVLEEYTRPARLVENSRIVTKPALTDPEIIEFETVGSLEAFNTDGLRTLLKIDVPFMKEKTLRYPGHIEIMRLLRETGFFSKNPVQINNTFVTPLEFTSKILFPQWKLKENEKEFTVMRIIVNGLEDNKEKTYEYNLFDQYDKKTKTSSMARTTGYTCTAAARLLLSGKFDEKGLYPPETIADKPGVFQHIIDYLKERNIHYDLEEY